MPSRTPATSSPPELPADLLTPLGAYLRLSDRAGGSFLLESVERGRLGRYSFVGAGSRLVSFEQAETLGEPVVGYLGYDAVATFEPTVPLPEHGPDVPESLFLVPDVLLRFDHARGVVEPLRGQMPDAPDSPIPRGTGPRGPLERFPTRDEHLGRVARSHHKNITPSASEASRSDRGTRRTSSSVLRASVGTIRTASAAPPASAEKRRIGSTTRA